MDEFTYAQRVAQYHALLMVVLPDAFEIDPAFLSACSADTMRVGLAGLYAWMSGLYRQALEMPWELGLPAHPDLTPRTGSRWKASTDAFLALPAFLYALGLVGEPEEDDDGPYLRVTRGALDSALQLVKIKKPKVALDGLVAGGLAVNSGGDPLLMAVRFPQVPETAFALCAFVAACSEVDKGGETQETFARVKDFGDGMRTYSTWCLGRLVDWRYSIWPHKQPIEAYCAANAELWFDGYRELAGFVVSESGGDGVCVMRCWVTSTAFS